MNKPAQIVKKTHRDTILPLQFLLLILTLSLQLSASAQEVVKGLEFSTTITGSGIEMGGVTTHTRVVITVFQDKVQITNLVPEKSPLYRKLKLNTGDTLTISYSTFRPHMERPDGAELADSVESQPCFEEKGRQYRIGFDKHPSGFNFYYSGGDSLDIRYLWKGQEGMVDLPLQKLEEIMRP